MINYQQNVQLIFQYLLNKLDLNATQVYVSGLKYVIENSLRYINDDGTINKVKVRKIVKEAFEELYPRVVTAFEEDLNVLTMGAIGMYNHLYNIELPIVNKITRDTLIHGYRFIDIFKNNQIQDVNRVMAMMITSIEEGKTPVQIQRLLKKWTKQRYKKFNNLTLRSIANQHLSNQRHEAHRMLEKEFKDSKFTFTATLDSRTSGICIRTDGKIWYKSKDIDKRPPLHFGCRSLIVYSTNGYSPKRRASLDYNHDGRGKQIVNMSYSEWIKTQPKWIQELTAVKLSKIESLF